MNNNDLQNAYEDLIIFNVNPFDLDSNHTQYFRILVKRYFEECKENKCYLLGGLVENGL